MSDAVRTRTTLALQRPALVTWLLRVGPGAAAAAIALSLVAGPAQGGVPGWAPLVALLALAAGVPHGAVDHLALAGSYSSGRRAALATLYLAAAAVAALAVLTSPAPAFVVVLAMSVWHFGSGDVELSDELEARTRREGWRRAVHVAAAGAVPVLLPLTAASSSATLVALEPRLAAVTDPRILAGVRVAVLLLAAVAALVLVRDRRPAAAAEIALLVLLALTVTPLLAFAVYFGGWHAVRHTLRLALDDEGRFDRDRLRIVVRDGVPSLAVTSAVLAAALLSGAASPPTVLWFALAAMWGLTVPHMVVVASFDRRRRRVRQSSAGISDRRPETASTRVS